jgi:spore maturation protein SpmA
MLNGIWLFLMLGSIVYASWTGRLEDVTAALFSGAGAAVQLVLGLVGAMVLLLGLMRVAFDGGLRDAIARALAPLLRRLFPDVPGDHPAMGAIVMNMASNMTGLGNAATPFGLKAMAELARLNRHPGSASDAMVLFLAINTSAITLLPPLGTIGVRLAAGSAHPEAIWAPTLIATTCSTVGAVTAFFLLRRLPRFRHGPVEGGAAVIDSSDTPTVESPTATTAPIGRMAKISFVAVLVALGVGLVIDFQRLSDLHPASEIPRIAVQTWLFPLLVASLLLIGWRGGARVYESMIEGAQEGLSVAVRIVPYLVAILVAVGMFRASGALEILVAAIDPFSSRIGVPAEALPMALLRPLSGSGAFGVMSEILTANGPDSFVGLLVSTLQGSTETTFYVLALYLGAAGIRDGRHALLACLVGDVAGFFGAVAACHWFFPPQGLA